MSLPSIPEHALAALSAQYDVIRPLGQGAMATVYLAQERLLQRFVAVKVLPAGTMSDAETRARFLREARTAARLTHPNIVPLYSFIESESTLLYVMGYVEGESLESLLEREGRLEPEVARRILQDVAAALGYAHAQGVVHRDVKPDNILIEAGTGRAFLADFGVARDAWGGDRLTRTGMSVGTPHYMSPEQVGGGALDGRSDLYALGIIGYRIVTGRLPFEGSTVQQVLIQRLAGEAGPVTAALPELADDLAVVITKSLRREPAERWTDAAALLAALHLDAERLPALPDTLEGVPSAGSRGLLGTVAAVIGCGVLYAWNGDPTWLTLGFALPVISFPVVFGMMMIAGRREGFTWRRMLKLFFLAPKGWYAWWPRGLRRPGDVWDRLPRQVRLFRSLLAGGVSSLFVTSVPAGVLYLLFVMSGDLAGAAAVMGNPVAWVGLVASVVTAYPALAWTYVWKRRYGVTGAEALKLLTEPIVSRFWKRPAIARILGDAPAAAAHRAPQTPEEFAHAVAGAVAQLPAPLKEGAREAARLARDAAAYAARIEHELAEIARELDPEERRKLEVRLVELTSPQLGAGRAQLRELVHAQLRVMDELEQRRVTLADAHERIERGLRQMWLQLSSLRSGGLGAEMDHAEITGRIRALCSDLDLQSQAAAEVAQLLGTPASPG